MDFIVEFYETAAGSCPVREFLDQLKASDPTTSPRWLRVWQNFAIVSITVSRYPKRLATVFLSCAMSASSTPASSGFHEEPADRGAARDS
jgi:hypothetical protein